MRVADKKKETPKGRVSSGTTVRKSLSAKRKRKTYVPLSFYWFKDFAKEFVNHKNFPDSVASVLAMASVAIAFPFYPIPVLIALIVLTFAITRIHPLAGLMALFFITLPMLIYQAPLFAWIFTLFISASLFIGYRHYRTIMLVYALVTLPFSYLGYMLEIPVFALGTLFVGYKRASIAAIVTVVLVCIFSGMTGIQNTAPIAFNASSSSLSSGAAQALQFMSPSKSVTTLSGFFSGWSSAAGTFVSYNVVSLLYSGFYVGISSFVSNIELVLVQAVVWLLVVFTMSNYVVKSRSPFKGAEASLYLVIILAAYMLLGLLFEGGIVWHSLLGFIMAPPLIFFLELSDIDVVRSLSVMKQDFLGKFGEAFEELTANSRETLDDIGDYEETKKELRQAVLEPIEHREIAGAYHVKPSKGILLFGPPGTGKTMIMRALSNEIRARFFYVKTSSLISPYPGESSQTLSRIFGVAAKHPPSVLFFDEIDGIAGKRDSMESEASRQLISTLLAEMDGFQKTEGVVIVGSTNTPQSIDPSVLRPGRFDKIIYMALPDKKGREAIFRKVAKRYPVSPELDYSKLAALTNRFSGADIANVCLEAARQVAEIAMKRVKVLRIETDDLLDVIKATKPSTSLAQVAEYEKFKLDYERRTHPEAEQAQKTSSLDDVIGLREAKKALYEAVELPLLHPALIKKYDIKNINGILLLGPPGTGKTMLMKAIASEVGSYRMIWLSGNEVSKEGIDKAVEAIKGAFNRAKENAPSIIFIDEMDSIFPERSNASEFGVQITGEFLQEMDSIRETHEVLIVGATNRPDALDSAIIRPGRIDKLIFTPAPEKEDRIALFKKNMEKAPTGDIDFARIAEETEGFTGADIANVCREAKMAALEKSLDTSSEAKVEEQMLDEIIRNTRPSAPASALSRYYSFITEHRRL